MLQHSLQHYAYLQPNLTDFQNKNILKCIDFTNLEMSAIISQTSLKPIS